MNATLVWSEQDTIDMKDTSSSGLADPAATSGPGDGQSRDDADAWPADLERLELRFEHASAGAERREWQRAPYHEMLHLHVFGEAPETSLTIYSRTLSPKGVDFFCRRAVKPGKSGWLMITLPPARTLATRCRVVRCRRADENWFEGALVFAREEMDVPATRSAAREPAAGSHPP